MKCSVISLSFSGLIVSCSSRDLISATRLLGTSMKEPVVSRKPLEVMIAKDLVIITESKCEGRTGLRNQVKGVSVMVEEMGSCLGRQVLVMGRHPGHVAIQLHFVDSAGYGLDPEVA